MKRPLELVWYWPVNCGEPCNCNEYWVGDRPIPDFAVDLRTKRLSDLQLIAEMYRAAAWLGALGRAHATDTGRNIVFEAAWTFGPITRDEHEWQVINRFANHPHYDESD